MAKESAGLLLYRRKHGTLEFLLVHPGGPLWKNRDAGAWSIPKGEIQADEDPLRAAQRELREELGFCPEGEFIPLAAIKQKGGKVVRAWAIETEWDPANLKSNTFTLPWPPRSGKVQEFPEVDRAAYFDLVSATTKINPAQVPLLLEVDRKLAQMK
ncbi:MAG TPA: NUDIX domain-containing protein [Verrucomicrobiae bacterium]|nr:NUDIX domain-containing protein [Verrucomicrobiae bacterium]